MKQVRLTFNSKREIKGVIICHQSISQTHSTQKKSNGRQTHNMYGSRGVKHFKKEIHCQIELSQSLNNYSRLLYNSNITNGRIEIRSIYGRVGIIKE